MIITIVALIGLAAQERGAPESHAALAAYEACVVAAATRLERSREAADIIAAAAVDQCGRERDVFRRTEAGDDWRYASVLMPGVDERVRRAAQSRVVAIRARRP